MSDSSGVSAVDVPSARKIEGGKLEAVFLPRQGMLCASLCYQGMELLRRIEDLEAAGKKRSTAGIPLLYPWANRLETLGYAVAGQTVQLAATSPLLHFDEHRQPMHGVPWSMLEWEIVEASSVALLGRLVWNRKELLAIYPFPHQVEMRASIPDGALTFETCVTSFGGPVPISFGFHPYFGIPGLRRAEW
jgi:galactose mutarotase-like enzyme